MLRRLITMCAFAALLLLAGEVARAQPHGSSGSSAGGSSASAVATANCTIISPIRIAVSIGDQFVSSDPNDYERPMTGPARQQWCFSTSGAPHYTFDISVASHRSFVTPDGRTIEVSGIRSIAIESAPQTLGESMRFGLMARAPILDMSNPAMHGLFIGTCPITINYE